MTTLRPSQKACLQAVLESIEIDTSSLIVAPTGFGKTVVMSFLCEALIRKGFRVLILTHNLNLIKQTAVRIDAILEENQLFNQVECINEYQTKNKLNILHGNHAVVLSTVQTLASLLSSNSRKDVDIVGANGKTLPILKNPLPHFDYIIVDEAHRIPPKSKPSLYSRVFDIAKGHLIGFTATPFRLASTVKSICGELDEYWFDDIAFQYTLSEAIDNEELCKYQILINEPENHRNDIEALTPTDIDYKLVEIANIEEKQVYLDHLVSQCYMLFEGNHYQVNALLGKTQKNKIIIFACTIEHANLIHKAISEHLRNIDVFVLHSKIDDTSEILRLYKASRQAVLININMAIEGIDIPDIDTIIVARPTASYVVYLQSIGRGLRTAPNKNFCLILDLVGNYNRHGNPSQMKKIRNYMNVAKTVANKRKLTPVEAKTVILSSLQTNIYLLTPEDIDKMKKANNIVEVNDVTYYRETSKKGNSMLVFSVWVVGERYPIKDFNVWGDNPDEPNYYFKLMWKRVALPPFPTSLDEAIERLKNEFAQPQYMRTYTENGYQRVIVESRVIM